ncbi:MAG: ABC transporter ATP-binding protein, partial [Ruthenibacterium sp.]
FVNAAIYAAVGVIGAISVVRGYSSVGQLSCFLTYANQYTKPFNEVTGVLTQLQNAFASAERLFDVIDAHREAPDSANAAAPNFCAGRVDMENIAFRYLPEAPLIDGFCLHVKPGERIAIVGPTGAGKTTMVKLLMRFYDVNSGAVLVDGYDVKQFRRNDLRDMFGMVLQDTWLYNGTVMENIRYGRLDATDDEVIAAAKAAQVHHFVKTLPEGYHTILNEEASNISAGQKQ